MFRMKALVLSILPSGTLMVSTRQGAFMAELAPDVKWEMVPGAKGVVEQIHGGNKWDLPLWHFRPYHKQFSTVESTDYFLINGKWPRRFDTKRKVDR